MHITLVPQKSVLGTRSFLGAAQGAGLDLYRLKLVVSNCSGPVGQMSGKGLVCKPDCTDRQSHILDLEWAPHMVQSYSSHCGVVLPSLRTASTVRTCCTSMELLLLPLQGYAAST